VKLKRNNAWLWLFLEWQLYLQSSGNTNDSNGAVKAGAQYRDISMKRKKYYSAAKAK